MVVSVYWGLLHEEIIERVKNSTKFGTMFGGAVTHMYLIHIFPMVASILNVLSTNCILRVSFWKAIVTLCAIYFTLLGVFTKKTGIVLYEFLNFKDWNCLLSMIGVTVITVVVNYIFCLIDW